MTLGISNSCEDRSIGGTNERHTKVAISATSGIVIFSLPLLLFFAGAQHFLRGHREHFAHTKALRLRRDNWRRSNFLLSSFFPFSRSFYRSLARSLLMATSGRSGESDHKKSGWTLATGERGMKAKALSFVRSSVRLGDSSSV